MDEAKVALEMLKIRGCISAIKYLISEVSDTIEKIGECADSIDVTSGDMMKELMAKLKEFSDEK